jgi:DNA-binding transcriptional regulator YhcF (GntR family)
MVVPELLTVREVAALLKISPESVTRRFQNLPGVIDLGSPETRFKRAYKVPRIPRLVLD